MTDHTHSYATAAVYVYELDGRKLWRKVRRECACGDKTFSSQRWTGHVYVAGRRGVASVPYNVDQARKASTLWIVEGEKDVETLRQHGHVATSAPDGAGSWDSAWNQYFNEVIDFVVVADKDPAGRRHALAVSRSLAQSYPSTPRRVVEVPDPYNDITEWLASQDADAQSIAPVSLTTGLTSLYQPLRTAREFDSGFPIPDSWTPLPLVADYNPVIRTVQRGEPLSAYEVPVRCGGCGGFLISSKDGTSARPCHRCRTSYKLSV